MTDREVIQELKMLKNDASEYIPEAVSVVEAIDKAIKALEQQTKAIKFQTSKGIVTGYLDSQKMIVYFNGLTMEFIQNVLKWEEVKDERETKSKEAEKRA